MSEVPEGLYYTKEHEWMRVEGDTVTIGITDHAQDMLTDIVYIELPEEGDVVGDMGEFAVVESVKSASPIFAPLAGTITALAINCMLTRAAAHTHAGLSLRQEQLRCHRCREVSSTK